MTSIYWVETATGRVAIVIDFNPHVVTVIYDRVDDPTDSRQYVRQCVTADRFVVTHAPLSHDAGTEIVDGEFNATDASRSR